MWIYTAYRFFAFSKCLTKQNSLLISGIPRKILFVSTYFIDFIGQHAASIQNDI
jgi:hypothetical protein